MSDLCAVRARWLIAAMIVAALGIVPLPVCVSAAEAPAAVKTETLEQQLLRIGAEKLATAARAEGDARRGAVVFYQPVLACRQCHVFAHESRAVGLGPDLSRLDRSLTDVQIVEAILQPSKRIAPPYRPLTVLLADGRQLVGLPVEETDDAWRLRVVQGGIREVVVRKADAEAWRFSDVSLMPAGQVNMIGGRQQFLDLVAYLIELRDGGPERARQLEPPPSLYVVRIPGYEKHVDHRGMIAELDAKAVRRGREIYERVCANCHGTRERPGSLPTAPRFHRDRLRNGADPYSMYRTLTRGFGLMPAQSWMVPQQKYDVIAYIREEFFRTDNPTQYVVIDEQYLRRVPAGTTRGPQPSSIQPWEQMDYGQNLVATYEVGRDGSNFAYKGNAIRLDSGPGGVTRGRAWLLFDYDTLRVAATWTGRGFIDFNGINFNGKHQVHPRIVGRVFTELPSGPGWADPKTDSFAERRLIGRDGRRYGPLPRDWAHYEGMAYHRDRVIVQYTVGDTDVLETFGWRAIAMDAAKSNGAAPSAAAATVSPDAQSQDGGRRRAAGGDRATGPEDAEGQRWPVFLRRFRIGPRRRPLTLKVAAADASGRLRVAERPLEIGEARADRVATVVPAVRTSPVGEDVDRSPGLFDGTRFYQTDGAAFRTDEGAFSVVAVVRTRGNGTIWARTVDAERWVPNGTTFFLRNGRACYDIGWVGVLTSRTRVNDGQWHVLTLTWDAGSGTARIYVDGRLDAQRRLSPKAPLKNAVLRVGFTNDDFPNPSALDGEIGQLGCLQRRLGDAEIQRLAGRLLGGGRLADRSVAGDPTAWFAIWDFGAVAERGGDGLLDHSGHGHRLRPVLRTEARRDSLPVVLAGVRLLGATSQRRTAAAGPESADCEWSLRDGALCLTIGAGSEPYDFILWFTATDTPASARRVMQAVGDRPLSDGGPPLTERLAGGPSRWPQRLSLPVAIGRDTGPLAVDVITHPQQNPWFCRMRLSGLDFLPDGDRMVVCDWDGNVWLVSGLSGLPERELPAGASSPTVTWQRIASGLFQPLGIKVFRGRIYVTCRDALYCLHDRNGDGEIDYYENVNNDHQVTDHFHEFAMGLQIDAEGNFYYAKSARHALPALVPHHGTLLRVSADGARTDILATGFRAANGVCLNDDGTFFVTDQEGHWTPKNRINWVRPDGRFYGNMLAYHDVTDPSDAAMEPPLCWITNAMDRSPAEPLWVRSEKWGPLNGALLNLSYGYGRIFVVPHERVGERVQGGVSPLPLHEFPTGIMRGRFHPQQGQLYVCGMVAWGSARQQPGGLFRVRYTGRPIHVPLELHARQQTLTIRFSGPLDRRTAEDSRNYAVKVWSLKRSANYGSKHYDEHPLAVTAARLAADGQTVSLTVPELAPTMGMEIRYDIRTADGQPLRERIHNTIHVVP